jgi:hypothetical protein
MHEPTEPRPNQEATCYQIRLLPNSDGVVER